jgi:hypothetical protein
MKIKNYLPKEYTTFKISFLSASIHLTFDDLVINVTCSGVPHEFGEVFFFFFFCHRVETTDMKSLKKIEDH